MAELACTPDFSGSTGSNLETTSSDFLASQVCTPSDCSPPPKKRRGTIDIVTPKVVAALDKCKISSRDAVHIITSVLEAAQLDVNAYIVNKTSIHEKRKVIREERFNEIKLSFGNNELSNIVVHWDGKLLPDLTNHEKVDRLPIIISSNGICKLLCVAKLENGKGKTQAGAIFDALQSWGLCDIVVGFCCDTTASHLGRINGAAVLSEQLLERDILYFPCRHHILEIILRAAFEALLVLTFKSFNAFATSGQTLIVLNMNPAWPIQL